MAQVTELVTKFLFEGNTAPLGRYNKDLTASIKLMAGFVTAGAAAWGAVQAFAHVQLQAVDALGDLSIETGVAVAQIQEMGFAAQLSGSSASALEQSLRGLSSSVGLAANDMGRGKEIFKELGIEVRDSNGQVKNAGVVLEEVRQRMNALNMSMEERRGFASRLGIDATLIQYLSRTDDEMAKLTARARELGTLTQEQAEAASAYNDALDVMSYGMTAIRQKVAVGLAPAMTQLAEGFTDLLAKNQDWIVKGIQVLTEFLGQLMAMIQRLIPFFVTLGVLFVALKIYALGFAGAMALIFSPVVLITAAVVAFLLILDDLIVGFQGGNSVIFAFGKTIKDWLIGNLMDAVEWISKVWQWVVKLTSALAGKVGKFLGLSGDGAQMVLPEKITISQAAGFQGVGGSTTNTDNRKIEQNVTIEVKANDPVAAGNAAADGVQRQLRDANAQLGVGGI